MFNHQFTVYIFIVGSLNQLIFLNPIFFQIGGVIGKAPTNFFNCSSNWPRLTGLFPLISPGTDEAFLSIVSMSRTRYLQNGPVQHIASPIYGSTRYFLVVAEPNWEQFSIYLHFNCTIA